MICRESYHDIDPLAYVHSTSSIACRPSPQISPTSSCAASVSRRTPRGGARRPRRSAARDAKSKAINRVEDGDTLTTGREDPTHL